VEFFYAQAVLFSTSAVIALNVLPVVNAIADDSPFVVKDIRLEGLMRVSPANLYAQLPLSNGDRVDEENQ
jgi:outer membrane protein insertion porin family